MARLLIRADGNGRIGAGHIVRCSAIAREAEAIGAGVLFVVSDAESMGMAEGLGFQAEVIDGDCASFSKEDGRRLAGLAQRVCAAAVLVDSYGVGDAFFCGLRSGLPGVVPVALIDDQYTFETGMLATPVAREVDVVVNYSYYANENAYTRAYQGQDVRMLLGPRYAPVRREFAGGPARDAGGEVTDVLVTTGSTNPGGMLERLSACARDVAPADAVVHVVVGPKAGFEPPCDGLVVRRGVRDMRPLMAVCQVAASAAGTTLYELNAMGVSTLAVPIVDNQLENARAFASGGWGLATGPDPSDAELAAALGELLSDAGLREALALRGRAVDGLGASRVAGALLAEGGDGRPTAKQFGSRPPYGSSARDEERSR